MRVLALGCLLVIGCSNKASSPTSPAPGAEVPAGGGHEESARAAQGPEFVVHEWGTYTSFAGSNGARMEGMHHEEEELPAFVHRRGQFAKGAEGRPQGVTQKLETPVLYFDGKSAASAKVHVDFPQGIISQWYPEAVASAPQVNELAPPPMASGSMDWEVTFLPGDRAFASVASDSVWAPSRAVASVPLAAKNISAQVEKEQFIFYRGLGRFDVPFTATAQGTATVAVTNDSLDDVAAVFLLRVHEPGGALIELGSLKAGETKKDIIVPVGGKESNLDTFVADASARVAKALVASGLFEDEARAMVDTWSRSYFRSRGTRILYVAPRAWTDKLLPLSVTPAPDKIVRTLVGRVEIMHPDEETSLVSELAGAKSDALETFVRGLGRLAEPKLRRTCQIRPSEMCEQAISIASTLP